ncbi:Sensor histidine kinase [Rhodovastum atsumiense]|uniref:Sensor histidine kinase n=1 Tax=Rhodovastum atsumiense TaxID=504468 RepID=A0A5M6IW67_9PROT|nr:sensor histidine kinase [Rhodovastum atsumiense]KAA5612566.1 sensor histidine kinase [Rhodovastum atsumiense]CAH2601348.1 Sensor histidine kinase [Rhodovastum atsumiense]
MTTFSRIALSASAPLGRIDGISALRAIRSLQAVNDSFLADLRQFRHDTRNTLRRITSITTDYPELRDVDTERRILPELQMRIALATVSDALFDVSSTYSSFNARLTSLCEGVVTLLRGPSQDIRLDVTATVHCPSALRDVVLRAAHEFVGNAVRHGLHVRIAGRLEVRLLAWQGGIRLAVSDDGWGCGGAPLPGEGLSLVRRLAARERGTVALERHGNRTLATLDLPPRGRRDAAD